MLFCYPGLKIFRRTSYSNYVSPALHITFILIRDRSSEHQGTRLIKESTVFGGPYSCEFDEQIKIKIVFCVNRNNFDRIIFLQNFIFTHFKVSHEFFQVLDLMNYFSGI